MLTLSQAPFNSEYILIVVFENIAGSGYASENPAEGML
jgi:hypothetical protein